MDVGLPLKFSQVTPTPTPTAASGGCWTCKVRRKKCDGKAPLCDACETLKITCYHSQAKPEWMDGGAKQDEMTRWLKIRVKENAHRRRGGRTVPADAATSGGEWFVIPQQLPHMPYPPTPNRPVLSPTIDVANDGTHAPPATGRQSTHRWPDCTLLSKAGRERIEFGRADTILIIFYLDSVFPFLFPLYQSSILQGGKAWILEMMLSSPVMRQTTLCQSSYYMSLSQGTADHGGAYETVLSQTQDAFLVLRQSLEAIDGPAITEHMHGGVRILASIMQLQRFEVAVMSYSNCTAHLSAAVALFRQLLDSSDGSCPTSRFNTVLSRLGGSSCMLLGRSVQVSSAEQAAFEFSSALLIFDDIIASTALQKPPQLYEYHRSLLTDVLGAELTINLGGVVGCENWVLVQIGEIAALDAWKQQCKRVGNLDTVRLVQRAMPIKNSLEGDLHRLGTNPVTSSQDNGNLLHALTCQSWQSGTAAHQSSLATQVWAHAALLYLSVVVSGWQPASCDVRFHVQRIIEFLTHQISSPALLRTMVWPFCVAGSLAEPVQEHHFRNMVHALKPLSLFGTMYRALEIMENVWGSRNSPTAADRDLAACFRHQDEAVLFV